ncbi:MAG: N-acetyl-gamma-glutamyl-phosphate reductase [Gammaproteobacteria bacterium]|nr:N-acetyl-gamma-glutamyl-phosphate reductase [Gammaproteobacteria bacterium]MCP5139667.1 N-acetyl-gamma-glutamyl-phosphate reductase [Chromatiales bacterium]
MSERIPALIVGGTGYVAGELLRLVAGHPQLELHGVSSETAAGTAISAAFPHLAPLLKAEGFITQADLAARMTSPRMALFAAAPHAVSAGVIATLLQAAEARQCRLTVVDVSSDFRFRNAVDFQAVYKTPHGAPELLPLFSCALPEHVSGIPGPHIGHPGCFATSMLAGAVPLLKLGICEPRIYATGITGSTGAGRTPTPTTHHPERHSNLFAYNPLRHRHAPEVVQICAQLTGVAPELNFVPHSGPFARGIHMTLQARLKAPQTSDELRDRLAAFYAGCEFVQVVDGMPRIKDVAGSNYCHIGVECSGHSVAVMVTLDNLIKGAAGGAVQWMNRLLGLPEKTGLDAPAPGWI